MNKVLFTHGFHIHVYATNYQSVVEFGTVTGPVKAPFGHSLMNRYLTVYTGCVSEKSQKLVTIVSAATVTGSLV